MVLRLTQGRMVDPWMSRTVRETSRGEVHVRRPTRVTVEIGGQMHLPNTDVRPPGHLPRTLVMETLELVEHTVAGLMYERYDAIAVGTVFIESFNRILGRIQIDIGPGW